MRAVLIIPELQEMKGLSAWFSRAGTLKANAVIVLIEIQSHALCLYLFRWCV